MDPSAPQPSPQYESPPPASGSYAYRAQTHDGQAISGSLDATNSDEARSKLASLGLRLMELSAKPVSLGPTRLGAGDFLAFNQQLAQLSSAGLPVEQGLKLIAQDLRGGRLAKTIEAVSAELDRGRSLPEAFEAHRKQFPPFYSNLIDAGIRTHNLPAMLTNLGRHVELSRKLRMRLLQTLLYPAMVLGAMMVVLLFMSALSMKFSKIYTDFGTDLPYPTQVMLAAGRVMPTIVAAGAIGVVLLFAAWIAMRATGTDRKLIDQVVLPLPMIGAILQRHLLARWCDALRLGIDAGQPLPQAIELASDALSWPGLSRDGRTLLAQLDSGQRIEHDDSMRYFSPSVCAVLNHAGQRGKLSESLAGLTDLLQKQADVRMEALLAIAGPVCLIALGVMIFFIVLAGFLPMLQIIRDIS